MAASAYKKKIINELDNLGPAQQKKVLTFIQVLSSSDLQGTPGKDLLIFAGTIPYDDVQDMAKAIEEDCERINPDEW